MNANNPHSTAAKSHQFEAINAIDGLDPLNSLDSGSQALSGESPMLASDVLSYLQEHPEFFSDYSDSLSQLVLPTQKDGNVISMANWQTQVLRDKADQHKARLEQLLQQASHNQKSHDKLFTLVSRWLAVVAERDIPTIISQDLRQTFSLDAVQIMVWDETRRVNYYPANEAWWDNIVVFSNSLRSPYCGPCKGFEIEKILAKQSPTGVIASLTIIPLWGECNRAQTTNSASNLTKTRFECIGVLLFGATDAQRFTTEMGTQFLQTIGDMVGAAVSRISQSAGTA